jgi:adenosine kinase
MTLLPKENMNRPRITIITQGSLPTIAVWPKDFVQPPHGSHNYDDLEVHQYQPTLVDSAKIVDTNGAGDAFVGGFLAQLAKEGARDDYQPGTSEIKDRAALERCIKCGQWLACQVVQRSGATYPTEKFDSEF